jgi:hypothetical protein
MSMPTREELLRRFAPVDDPEIEARARAAAMNQK